MFSRTRNFTASKFSENERIRLIVNLPESDNQHLREGKSPATQSQLDPQEVKLLMQHMGSFRLELGEKESLTGAWQADAAGPSKYQYRDFTLATEADGSVLSRKADLTGAKFADEGRLYLVPNLSQGDLERLRAGQTVGEKWATDIMVNFHLDEAAVEILLQHKPVLAGRLAADGGYAHINLSVVAKDFAQTANTFFGDRPLDNPGYSEIKLKGAVSIAAQTTKTIDKLDVYKVEQRLRYLGFSSFDKTHDNKLTEFSVDGRWGVHEDTALRGFFVATNYTQAAYWGGFGYEATESAKPAARRVDSGGPNLQWLNAFNAPHMMNAYDALPIPRNDTTTILNRFQNGARKIEAYTTSWVYDWLQAWRQSQDAFDRLSETERAKVLDTDHTRISGLTSPSGYKANGEHEKGGHSTLMALDWSLKYVIGRQEETKFNNSTITLAAADRTWSVANAIALANKLTETDSPGEKEALKKFLSLYSLTRDDGSPNDANGGWEDIAVQNGSVVKQAIFGSGDGSPIQAVFLGMDGQRTYPNMREIIKALGLQNIKPSGGDHHTHFHIDFRTPDRMNIGGGSQLQADSPPNPETSNAIGEDPMHLLETLMAAVVAQAQPAPTAVPAATLQVAAASAATKTKYVAALCTAQDPYAGTSEWGQNRTIGVELAAMLYVREQLKRNADLPLASSVKVEKYPQHGTLDIGYPTSVSKQNGIQEYWRYTPNPGYEHGNDHATFLVDVQGTPVRVVVVLKVRQQKGSDADWAKICSPSYGVIANAVSTGDLLSTWQRQTALIAILAEASKIVGSFQELVGTSLGQTTGPGPSARITLDKDAAGHGWYIDETPLDNTDDYLPTSNSNIWQAKAGSAAEGKMDMLSVLLHEYGHALGLDHSADAGDFMASTLQPGQRRLPSSDELALMGQLVAQIKADMQMADASPSAAKTSSALAASAANVGLIFDGVGFFFV